MLRIFEAVIQSKKVEILPLSHWKVSGLMSSATLCMVGWAVDEGNGMKFSRVRIHGVSQIGVCWPSPIFIQRPLLRMDLDFKMSFHNHELFSDGETCMKGTPLRYFAFNRETQVLSSSVASDQPNLEIRAWLVSKDLRRPEPP
ncbi:hypothetical protein FCV25MIE_00379 [Fagus crenata]